MPMRGRPTGRSVRAVFLAFALTAGVVAGSWMVQGFAWRGLAKVERARVGGVLAQADTAGRQDSSRSAPPSVPGAVVAPPPSSSAPAPTSLWSRLSGLVGLVLILAIGIGLSRDRRAIRWRVIAWGLGLQLLFAIFVLRIPAGQALFRWLGDLVTGILGYSYICS